jgi:hypothetical protein
MIPSKIKYSIFYVCPLLERLSIVLKISPVKYTTTAVGSFRHCGTMVFFQTFRVCSVWGWGGMEWNHSIPLARNRSIPVFGLDKKIVQTKHKDGTVP